jgi:hypothetical protein
MPAAIPDEIRARVIKQWLSGDTRAKIASANSIGEGSVTNIVSDFNKGLADSEFESIREIAVESRKQGFRLRDLGPSLRLYNYVKKLGANQDQIESFIANLANSSEPEKLIDVANQVAQLSRSESMPLAEFMAHVKQKEEEKQMLEGEIKQKRAILASTNVDIQTINEYKQLKEELNKRGLSIEDPDRLLTILKSIKQLKYDPNRIISEFSRVNSLRRSERILKNNCQILENQIAEYRQVLPLLQRIRVMGIGIDKLIPFNIAVNEKTRTSKLSISAAAYRVIEDIENYNRISGMKNELSNLAMQRFAINQMSAPRDKAITALLRLQAFGVTDDEILKVYEYLNRARFESAATIRR